MPGTTAERTIERTLRIEAPRRQVFRALLDPGTLSRWLFAAVDMTPERGGGYTFEWRDSSAPASATGEILDLVPDEKLVLSWYMEADGVESTASFELKDAEGGATLLRFVQSGLPAEPEWLPRWKHVGLEWDKVLLNLRFLIEERGEGKHLFYFRTSVTLRAAAQRAFRAWLTPTALREWLARDVYLIPEEGQDLTGITLDTGRTLSVRFHRVEPERHLRMTWSEGGSRGLLGVSFWPAAEGIVVTLTLRSFALMEGERPIIQALWEKRFQRLTRYLERRPLGQRPAGAGRFTVTRELESTPQRAWTALTDASILRRWFVGWTDFTPRAGAEYTILWNSYGELMGRVEEVRPPEFIRYTWDLPELAETTEVVIRLLPNEKQPGLCQVELTHSGFGEGTEWEEQRRAHEWGWKSVLGLLDFYLRRGAGKEPREFGLRRRVPFPLAEARTLLGTAEGLQRWLATRAEVEPRDGGRYEFEVGHKTEYRGAYVICSPETESSIELESPEPLFLNWWVAPDPNPGYSRLALSVTAYGVSERWFEARRVEWTAAIDRLAAGS